MESKWEVVSDFKTLEGKSYIYKITNLNNNKVYVGVESDGDLAKEGALHPLYVLMDLELERGNVGDFEISNAGYYNNKDVHKNKETLIKVLRDLEMSYNTQEVAKNLGEAYMYYYRQSVL